MGRQFFDDRAELRIRGQVGPLLRVRVVIVQLLAAVDVADIPPAFGSDRVLRVVVGRERRLVPFCGRIREQRDEAAAVETLLPGQVRQVEERRKQVK